MIFRPRPDFANGCNDVVERPLPTWNNQLDQLEGKILLPGNFEELQHRMLGALSEGTIAVLAAPFAWIASKVGPFCIG